MPKTLMAESWHRMPGEFEEHLSFLRESEGYSGSYAQGIVAAQRPRLY